MHDAEEQLSSFLDRIRNPSSGTNGANGANALPVDGISNPEATNRVRARERRAAIPVRTAVTAITAPTAPTDRIPWGSTSLAPNAVALGRLFSYLARVVDGIAPCNTPQTPQTPQPTLEALREDAASYALSVALAIGEGGWTVEDEVFHFARGVEAYLSGVVGVGRDSDIVTQTEQLVLVAKGELRDAALHLSEAERAAGFDSVAVRLLDGSLGIIRPPTGRSARSKVLSSYVSHHVYQLHRESSRGAPCASRKRMLTEEADREGKRQRELQKRQGQQDVQAEMMMEAADRVAGENAAASFTGPNAMYAAFATNRPLTIEDASKDGEEGVTNVYRSTLLSSASYDAYASQVEKMRQEFERADGGGSGVGTHLLLLTPRPSGGEVGRETDAAYRKRAATQGEGVVHVLIDTRTFEQAQSADQGALQAGLDAMDEVFASPETSGTIKYGKGRNAPRAKPSVLWKHAQVLLDEVVRAAQHAKDDGYTGAVKKINEGRFNAAYEPNVDASPSATSGAFVEAQRFVSSHVPAGNSGRMIIRASRPSTGQFDGMTMEEVTSMINQFAFAAKHGVGIAVSACLVFDHSRMDRTSRADRKFGVMMLVERMQLETDDILNSKNSSEPSINATILNPRLDVDGMYSHRQPFKTIGQTTRAMVAVWKLLAKMSSAGIAFFDFHLGNVMFNRVGASGERYECKIIDFDARFGAVLSPDDVAGPLDEAKEGWKQGWKPLLVLNALTVACYLKGDAGRERLLQAWLSADSDALESKSGAREALYGAVLDIGQFNRFKKMCREVSDSIAELVRIGEPLSVPQQLLALRWKGGKRGSGTGVESEAGEEAESAFESLRSALLDTTEEWGDSGPRRFANEAFRKKQDGIATLLRRVPDARTALGEKGVGMVIQAHEFDMLRAKYHYTDEMKRAYDADRALRFVLSRPWRIASHMGRIRSGAGEPYVDVLRRLIFDVRATGESLRGLSAVMPNLREEEFGSYKAAARAVEATIYRYEGAEAPTGGEGASTEQMEE